MFWVFGKKKATYLDLKIEMQFVCTDKLSATDLSLYNIMYATYMAVDHCTYGNCRRFVLRPTTYNCIAY